jgi:PAS domain S-box-containing protein
MVDVTARVESERIRAVFADVAEELNSVDTPEEAGRIILQAADHLIDWDASFVATCQDTEHIRVVVAYDLQGDERVQVDPTTMAVTPTSMSKRVMKEGATLILRPQPELDEHGLVPFGQTSRRSASLMFVPIRKGAECVGLISIQSYRPGVYAAEHLQLLQTLADHCGGALQRIAAQQAVRESEQRFRNIFENALVGIYRTTPDGRVLLANPALVRMLGFQSSEELLAQNLERASSPHCYPREEFKRLIEEQGVVKGLETTWTRQDGSVVYLRESGVAVRDANGATMYYEGTVEDITERRLAQQALEQSERDYRELYDFAPVGYHELDQEGKLVRVNRTEAELLGYAVEEMVGKFVWEFIAPEERQEARYCLQRKFAGELPPHGTERTYLRKDGRRIEVHVEDRLVHDSEGKVVAIRSTLRDISFLKRAERALKASLRTPLPRCALMTSLG